jgi:hypothetical protein
MAEHSAVNRRVVSSSLTCGANLINKLARQRLTGFCYLSGKSSKVTVFTLTILANYRRLECGKAHSRDWFFAVIFIIVARRSPEAAEFGIQGSSGNGIVIAW